MSGFTVVTEPNSKFVTKHVCITCQDRVEDAEAFARVDNAARRANGWAPTGKNTVFIASDMVYLTDVPSTRIVFQDAAPKYDCQRRGSDGAQWSCRHVGQTRAQHDAGNGHYFFRGDMD